LFKISLDLQLARGRKGEGNSGEEEGKGKGEELVGATRWEVLGLRAFVVVAIVSRVSLRFFPFVLLVLYPGYRHSSLLFPSSFQIMSIFSSIFSRGFLRVLPPPFDSSALCFRRTFLLYAIPLFLNLTLTLYSLGRIFLISHWRRNSWEVVLADGRMRRAGVFVVWVGSSFAQELGVGEITGSGMWLPACLGAGVLMGEHSRWFAFS